MLLAGILIGSSIHHAGGLRSVDLAVGFLVIDERVRLGSPLLTRIHVADGTVLVRVRRAGGEFRGKRVPPISSASASTW